MNDYPENFIPLSNSFEDLINKSEQFAFLVGAGISMNPPSNIPSARQFMKTLLELFTIPNQIEKFLSIEDLRYERIVEEIKRFHDPELKFLDFLEIKENPNRIHSFLAEMIRLNQTVITTNFDYMIERALFKQLPPNEKTTILPITTKEDYVRHTPSKTMENLNQLIKDKKYTFVKIHGAKKNIITGQNTAESLVTTITALGKDREKGETFAIESYKKPLVNAILKDRVLIIMGYSGNDDFSVGPLLKEFPDLKKMIWIEHSNNDIQIFKVQKPDLSSQTKTSSKTKLLLSDLCKHQSYDVYYVTGKTLEIVSNVLNPILSVGLKFDVDGQGSSEDIPFEKWIRTIYPQISELQKYKMTAFLLNELGNKMESISVAEHGKILAEEKKDFNAQAWFFYHIGSVYRSKEDYDQAIVNIKRSLEIEDHIGNISNKLLDLNQIGTIYSNKKDFNEAYKYFNTVLQLDKQFLYPYGRKLALNNLGELYRTKKEYDQALKYFNEALLGEQISTDLQGKSVFLYNIGTIYEAQQNYDKALQFYEEAVGIGEQIGELHIKALFLNKIAMIYRNKLDYEKAIKYMEDAMRIAELLADYQTIMMLATSTGGIYNYKKEYLKALDLFEKGIQIAEHLDSKDNKELCLDWISQIIQNAQGDINPILKFYEDRLSLATETNNLAKKSQYLQNIGLIYQKKGNLNQMFKFYEDALQIADLSKEFQTKASILIKIGSIYLQNKDLGKALKYIENAQVIAEKIGDYSLNANSLVKLGQIYEMTHEDDKALASYEKSVKCAEISQNIELKLESLINIGISYHFKKDDIKALKIFEEGVKIAEDFGDPRWMNKFNDWINSLNKNKHN